MFHTSHIHVPRNRRPSALRTFITSSSFGPPDTKEPLRRGILLTAVAFVMLLIGGILTWLGFNDVFGGRMSMTGPLLIALSLLLLLLSCRQFLLARKRNTNSHPTMQLDSVTGETLTAVVVNRDNGLHPATIIVDRYNRIGYDNSISLHRHSDDDCAPPSYHEVTQLSSSSNTPSCTHDGQDELPPTYEETMGSSIYSPHPLFPSFLHSQQERGSCIPSSNPSVAMFCGEMERLGSGFTSARVSETDMGQGHTSASIGSLFANYTHKPSQVMMPATPGLQRDMVPGRGQGVATPMQNVAIRPVIQHSQHSLALPPQHMSAPASPRQLSAPPSPHPFSAPPSPRQLSTRQHPTTPLQYMSASSSPQQLSAPLSLHMLSAPSSPHTLSGPPSPHTYSTPSSPCPVSGQHRWTPPPQYTSTPPSPHQRSTPPSPRVLSSPPSPCCSSGSPPMHPLSPQPQFSASSLAGHHPGPHASHHFASPSPISHPAQPWAPFPQAGSSHEGYTCFTYNFVTPLPVETSTAAPILRGHTSTISYPVRGCAASSAHPSHSDRVGEGRPSLPVAQPQAHQGTVYVGHEGVVRAPLQPEVSMQGVSETSQSQRTFPSRTDIQANI